MLMGSVLLLAAGPAPQLLYPSDVAAYLDACQRAALGQWLGRDYDSALGPAALLPTVLAMKLGGIDVHALAAGSAIAWLVFGTLAWLVARPRMPNWLATGFAIFVAGTAAAPYTPDFGKWNILSYGMVYNRLAWAALSIQVLAALLPRLDKVESRLAPVGFGACAMWLWTLKPNFLLILVPLAIYHWFTASSRATWISHSLLGALGMLLVVWFSVRFSPLGYVEAHLGMSQEARHGIVAYTPGRTLQENAPLLVVLTVIWAVVLKTSVAVGTHLRLILVLISLGAATLVANLTNNQFSEIPFWGALGWVAAAMVARNGQAKAWRPVAGLAGVVLGLGFTWQPIASIPYSFAWHQFAAPGFPPALEVNSPAWKGLPLRPYPGVPIGPDHPLESPGNFAAWLNDGLSLYNRTPSSPGAIVCLDWMNPFPFATGTNPVIGDAVAWHVGRTSGVHHRPDVTGFITNTAVVMEPIRSIQPDSLAFKRALFEPFLTEFFTLAGESSHWRIWVRREPMPSGQPPSQAYHAAQAQ